MSKVKAKDLQRNYKSYYKNFDAPDYPDSIREAIETLIEPNDWGQPMFRIVWGMDSTITEWFAGDTHMKYVGARTVRKWVDSIRILDISGNEKQVITDKDIIADMVSTATDDVSSSAIDEIIVPMFKEEITEIGLPYFIVERFAYPHEFGTPEEWEAEQFEYSMVAGDTRGEIELKATQILDNFPSQGKYVQFMVVQTPEGLPRLPDNELVDELKARIQYYDSLPTDLVAAKAQFDSQLKEANDEKWADWEADLQKEINERVQHYSTPRTTVL